jgi:hypothetical protein
MVNTSPPPLIFDAISFAMRIARVSPSTANGVPAKFGSDPGTKVFIGCIEPTAVPFFFSGINSDEANAPLVCSATLPLHDIGNRASPRATDAIASSGTHSKITSASSAADATVDTLAPTRFANADVFRNDLEFSRAMISFTRNPAECSESASMLPKLPAPTIDIVLSVAMTARS